MMITAPTAKSLYEKQTQKKGRYVPPGSQLLLYVGSYLITSDKQEWIKTQFLQTAVSVLLSHQRSSSNVMVLCARGIPKKTFQQTI